MPPYAANPIPDWTAMSGSGAVRYSPPTAIAPIPSEGTMIIPNSPSPRDRFGLGVNGFVGVPYGDRTNCRWSGNGRADEYPGTWLMTASFKSWSRQRRPPPAATDHNFPRADPD
ncbi:hypothetical protein GCM10010403_50140 [Glycomyces rutgersensis]|uniref:Uncharacterized protein n=1 Tax=Glycomyces rutgersensis TaxID=58115 RepID=A0ABN3GGP4_9ACTN